MAYYDEQLQFLQQQTMQKKRKESKLKELCTQHEVLSTKADKLQKSKLDAQADVEHLEGRSLTAFFYAVIGKKVDANSNMKKC